MVKPLHDGLSKGAPEALNKETAVDRLLREQRFSLTELARQEDVSIPTTWRWATRGIKGICLETIQIGGRRYTSSEAFHRFVVRTNGAKAGEQSQARTSRQRERDIKRAEQALARDGFGDQLNALEDEMASEVPEDIKLRELPDLPQAAGQHPP